MKKTIFYLFPILLILSGCYIYRPYSDEAAEVQKDAVSLRPTSGAESGILSRQNTQQKDKNLKNDAAPARRQTVNDDATEQAEQKKSTDSSLSFGKASSFESRQSAQQKAGAASTPRGEGIKGKILPDHYYKITVAEREYKIQADQWEGDTLVSHILRKPKKVLRFHEDQIDEELIKERIFSKPYSDVITVGSYAAGGAAILLLVL